MTAAKKSSKAKKAPPQSQKALDLDEIDALVAATTPGIWHVGPEDAGDGLEVAAAGSDTLPAIGVARCSQPFVWQVGKTCRSLSRAERDANARFIALAHALVPLLTAEIRRQDRELREASVATVPFKAALPD